MLPNAFAILWDNKPVAIDDASGGYPFKTDSPGMMKWWRTKEEAERYVQVFENSRSYEFYAPRVKIVEIQFRIMGDDVCPLLTDDEEVSNPFVASCGTAFVTYEAMASHEQKHRELVGDKS